MEDHNYIVYMLKCNDGSFYTGYTTDLEHRVQMHTEGKGAKYTRGRGPFQVVFIERHETKEAAMQREYAIKQLSRQDKVKLIRDQLKEVIKHANSKEL